MNNDIKIYTGFLPEIQHDLPLSIRGFSVNCVSCMDGMAAEIGMDPMNAGIWRQSSGWRSISLMLSACVFAGCQSMSRSQQAWQFPPQAEPTLGKSPYELTGLDLLPKPAQKFELDPARPVPKVFSLQPEPKKETALVQTSAQATAATPQPPTPEPPAQGITLPPLPAPVATPATTKIIVEKLVAGSGQLNKSLIDQPDGELELPTAPARPLQPLSDKVIVDSNLIKAAVVTEPLPPLKPEETAASTGQGRIIIPRVAICSAVRGRGNFVAMPDEKITPGATILVYWEMEGLARSNADKMVKLAATVELVRPDRDQIVASARETLEKVAVDESDGDYVALKWQIPPEVPPGEYRVRVSTTDQTKSASAESQTELTIRAGTVK